MDQNDDNAALSAADSWEESIVNDFNQQKGSISEEALVDDTDRRVNGSKSILFDKLDWWISDEDILSGLATLGLSISDLVLSEFGFLEHKLNGKSKGSCFVLFKSSDASSKAFLYFKSNPLCEGCIIKEGHPSVTRNPYRVLHQNQRRSSAQTSNYPVHSNTNRPGATSYPLRREKIRNKRSNSIERRSVRSRSRSRDRDSRRRSKSRSRSRARRNSRSPPRIKERDTRDRRKDRSRSRDHNCKDRSRFRDLNRKDRSRSRSRDKRKDRSRSRDHSRIDRSSRDKIHQEDRKQKSKRAKRSRSREPPSRHVAEKPVISSKVDLRSRLKRKSLDERSRIDVDFDRIPSPEERTPNSLL